MDAERLDVPAGSFSVVLCGFGIFFLPAPERAMAGFRRALAPGGTVAVSTWGADDDADEWWAWKWSYSLRGLLEQLPAKRLDQLRRDAVERIEAMRGDGGLRLRLEAHFSLGRREAGS